MAGTAGRLRRQVEYARRDIASWPLWMLRGSTMSGGEMTIDASSVEFTDDSDSESRGYVEGTDSVPPMIEAE